MLNFFNFKKLFLIFFIFNLSLFSQNLKDYLELKELTNVQLIRVYDGDTFFCNIPYLHFLIGSNISVRIRGIDTAEIRGGDERTKKIALQQKEALTKLLENKKITLYNLNRDKYFRILADVKADDIDVKEYMLKNNFAKKYDGKTKNTNW